MKIKCLVCVSMIATGHILIHSDAHACDPAFYDGRTSTISVVPDFSTPKNCLALDSRYYTEYEEKEQIHFVNDCDEDVLLEFPNCVSGSCMETLYPGDTYAIYNPITSGLTNDPPSEPSSESIEVRWSTSDKEGLIKFSTTYTPPSEEKKRIFDGSCRPVGGGCGGCSSTPSAPIHLLYGVSLLGLFFTRRRVSR